MTAISVLTSHASRDGLAVRPGHRPRNGPTIQAGKKPGLVTGARKLGRSAAISTTVRLEATSPSSEIAAIAGAHSAPSERPRGEIAAALSEDTTVRSSRPRATRGARAAARPRAAGTRSAAGPASEPGARRAAPGSPRARAGRGTDAGRRTTGPDRG